MPTKAKLEEQIAELKRQVAAAETALIENDYLLNDVKTENRRLIRIISDYGQRMRAYNTACQELSQALVPHAAATEYRTASRLMRRTKDGQWVEDTED